MFADTKALKIPEGDVVKVEWNGVVLWELQTSKPVVLEVAKVTSNTYAGETLYENEEFILLDIYPKTNGTVNVTYGGLTKTITDTSGAESPNAQQVYFGTFNGVSDSVATPASGELVIEGEYENFGCGTYQLTEKTISKGYASCITTVTDCGDIKEIVSYAFYGNTNLTTIQLPEGITSIGSNAFYGCTNLTLNSLPNSVTHIGDYAFKECFNVNIRQLPSNLVSIGDSAFLMSEGLPKDGATTAFSILAMYGATIILPETIQSIGDDAYRTAYSEMDTETMYSSYISEIVILATTPPTISKDTFGNYFANKIVTGNVLSQIKVTVPAGCGDAYRNADVWKSNTDNIVEAS